jgi:receptor protein-tyrosine kinase
VERAAEKLGEPDTAASADRGAPLSRARFRDLEDRRRGRGSRVAPSKAAAGSETTKHRQAPSVTIDLTHLSENGYITPDRMRSHLSEEVRLLKQDVLDNFYEAGYERSNLAMVTSANPGEGKTFTAINLAISLAGDPDVHVLLVDADFANPQISKTLGIEPTDGLLDILADPSRDLSDVILRTNIDRMSVIPAGESHEMSVELLGSQRMQRLTSELSDRYSDRIVIFDTPPLLASVDPTVLAKRMGQILVVVEANRTDKGDLQQAVERLPADAYLGLVLNKGTGLGASSFAQYHKYGYSQ